MSEPSSRFQKAIDACPQLKLRDGLQALSSADRQRIHPQNPRSVTGSVDIDRDLRASFPEDNRWDYAVGYRGADDREKAYFIEVHPAETSEVKRILQKARALSDWARQHAPELWAMPRQLHWVASGRCHIRLNDAYRRQLALAGLGSPKEMLDLT